MSSEGSNYALMTVKGGRTAPSLAEAAKQLGLEEDALDRNFGVVIIDPDRGLFSVRVDASKLSGDFDPEKGPFSDPPIAPMRPR
jgi:hypothetical protein